MKKIYNDLNKSCIFPRFAYNEASNVTSNCEEKKTKQLLSIPVIREPINNTSCEDNDEFRSLIHSHPGSICNVNEIEEDERRQTVKAVRNELIRVLPVPFKKQKPMKASTSPV